MSELPRGVIGVPGRWQSHEEVVAAIAAQPGGYLPAGSMMLHVESQRAFTLEEYDFEPRMREAFGCAGGERLTETELDEIAGHARTLYVGADVGSIETTRALMQAARVLLEAGGLGVKVESSGVAHSRDMWLSLCDDEDPRALLHAIVALVGDAPSFYSCGMHHFGLRDVTVEAPLSAAAAGKLMEVFNSYQLIEQIDIVDGDTFSLESDEPRYLIDKAPCVEFEPGDLFHNPYGMWRLTPLPE